MTVHAIKTTTSGQGHAERASAALRAAVCYAEQAWPVLPGSVFDGRRYVVASTCRVTDGLRPVLPRDQASADARTVAQWWRVTTPLAPSVLVRSGRAFDAVSVSRELAIEVIKTSVFRDSPGPVTLRPDQGRAYFLIGRGQAVLPPDDARPTVVETVPSGAWLAMPPTRTAVGAVSWLASPRFTGWEPVGAAVLAEALRTASPRVETAVWGG